MKVKKLSELPLDKCIYMSIGPHCGEKVEQIMERKSLETDSECGYSLWAYSSPKAKQVNPFCEGMKEIYVVMAETGKDTEGEAKRAQCYYKGEERVEIPSNIKVTYSEKSRSAYALVVKEYYKIDTEDNVFLKGEYERKEYFNGFELLEKKQGAISERKCRIAYAAKLQQPFSVYIE